MCVPVSTLIGYFGDDLLFHLCFVLLSLVPFSLMHMQPQMYCSGWTSATAYYMVAYDDIASIEYFGLQLPPYWRRYGEDASALLVNATKQYVECVVFCYLLLCWCAAAAVFVVNIVSSLCMLLIPVPVCIYMCVCVCVCMFVYICVYVCIYMCVHSMAL